MRKYVRVLAALLCALLLVSCGAKPAQNDPVDPGEPAGTADWTPVTVTDDLGRQVTLEARPQRV